MVCLRDNGKESEENQLFQTVNDEEKQENRGNSAWKTWKTVAFFQERKITDLQVNDNNLVKKNTGDAGHGTAAVIPTSR